MAQIFLLDSEPAGLACHKPGHLEAANFRAWLFTQRANGAIIVIPEIVDYEVRRELIRSEAWDSVSRLDELYHDNPIRYLPISTQAMRKAAELWAKARQKGQQTAGDQEIDGDVILSAQAMQYCSNDDDWLILTENVDHISRYVANRARSRRAIVEEWIRSPTSLS